MELKEPMPDFTRTYWNLKELVSNSTRTYAGCLNLCVKMCEVYELMHKNVRTHTKSRVNLYELKSNYTKSCVNLYELKIIYTNYQGQLNG